jgi:HlyD family secretion protein
VLRHGEAWAVFALVGGRVALRPVTLGQRNAAEAEVINGLAAGDLVVLYPSDRIRDGIRAVPR